MTFNCPVHLTPPNAEQGHHDQVSINSDDIYAQVYALLSQRANSKAAKA